MAEANICISHVLNQYLTPRIRIKVTDSGFKNDCLTKLLKNFTSK